MEQVAVLGDQMEADRATNQQRLDSVAQTIAAQMQQAMAMQTAQLQQMMQATGEEGGRKAPRQA